MAAADFYPRPPRGGRHGEKCYYHQDRQFLSTPSARRATQSRPASGPSRNISIHALREEGDKTPIAIAAAIANFYPRPPRGGRRWSWSGRGTAQRDFYPRPPRGGRHLADIMKLDTETISIHALREEGDPLASASNNCFGIFLSTPSARRATWCCRCRRCTRTYFYPRPPRGGRHLTIAGSQPLFPFLSTPSARRATQCERPGRAGKKISIHALREEGDAHRRSDPQRLYYFYPRPPRGGRQQKQRQNLYFQTNYTTFCTNLEEP